MPQEPIAQTQFEERTGMTKIGLFTLIPTTFLVIVVTLQDLSSTGLELAIDLVKQPQLWIMLSVLALLLSLKLKVRINDDKISYQMLPFHPRERLIFWQEIENAELLKINALREFGGWGIRRGRLGKAYNPEGNIVLHINTTKGTPINITIKNHALLSAIAAQRGWKINPLRKVS